MSNLTFNEKSAWAMVVALGLSGFAYLFPVLAALFGAGVIIPPVPIVFIFVIILIVLSTLTHIVAALSNTSEANETRDERDVSNLHFGGHWSGLVLGLGVILSLLAYYVFQNGDMLAHAIFTSLIFASLVEYILIIIAYRRAL